VRRKIPLAEGETARTGCVRVLIRSGVEEKTGEPLPPAVVARRVRWCADLVAGMVTGLLADHWNAPDVARLASGWMPASSLCRPMRGWPCAGWAGPPGPPGA
jgi:hypothetical protein